MAGLHITIQSWLDAINMMEYVHLFQNYAGVEDLFLATEAEIRDIGISNSAHVTKVISSLRILKDKFDSGYVNGAGLSQQRIHSKPLSEPNSPTSPYPDFQRVIVSPEKIQADLLKELSGDPGELRSRSWYHGSISRLTAESLVANNGDFLIRDCISKPGDLVLTCRWKDTPLSFIINSIVGYCNPGHLPVISYQFEEEQFPTIEQLIGHYREQGKPVTVASDAILKNAVARRVPLSYYDTKYGGGSCNGTPSHSPQSSPFVTPPTSPRTSPNINRRLGTSFDDQSNQLTSLCQDANNNRSSNSNNSINNISSGSKGNSNSSNNNSSNNISSCKENINNNNNNRDLPKPSRPASIDNLPIINVTPPGENLDAERSRQSKQQPSPPAVTRVRVGEASELCNGLETFRLSMLQEYADMDISESDSADNPPPKPSRVASVRGKVNPALITASNLSEGHRIQGTTRGQVNLQSNQMLRDELPQRVSPTLSLIVSENGQNPDCVGTNTPCAHHQGYEQNGFPAILTTSQNVWNHSEIRNTRIPQCQSLCSDTDQSHRLRTYQLVARSRSFQLPQKPQSECYQKGTKTLPNKLFTIKCGKFRFSCTDEQEDHDRDNHQNPSDTEVFETRQAELKKFPMSPPFHASHSYITPELFTSGLLPKGHKVLDQLILTNVKTILVKKSPRDTALHLTKYDLALTRTVQAKDLGLGVVSGLELLTLPQGKQLRQDVIDRWEHLRMFVQSTLLTSQTVEERARLFSFWILTCQELKTTAGNLFSFAAIMAALTSTEVSRLSDTWSALRHAHTPSAVVFDTKLRPEFVSLNDASCDLPLENICLPCITPVCYLLERDPGSTLLQYYWEEGLDPIASAIDALLGHLELARVIASQASRYRVAGKALLATVDHDPELSQILSPEFHMLILCGDKGIKVNRPDRLSKLGQIFSLFSYKCQVSEDCDTEV